MLVSTVICSGVEDRGWRESEGYTPIGTGLEGATTVFTGK